MSNYWADRTFKTRINLQDIQEQKFLKQLAKEYKATGNRVIERLGALYNELLQATANNTLLASDLYKYNKLYEVLPYINAQLRALGEQEIKITEQNLTTMYNLTSSTVGKSIGFDVINPNSAKIAVQEVWCADGKSWSTRLWGDKTALQEKLQAGLLDCVTRGASKDELIKTLMMSFSIGFNSSSRIARTELTHIQNKATLDKYKEAGIKKYQFLATNDDRTCEEDKELNGKVFLISEAQVGVNFPPIHPNCRCSILAVTEEVESLV